MYIEIVEYRDGNPLRCSVVFHEGILQNKRFDNINIKSVLDLIMNLKLQVKIRKSEIKTALMTREIRQSRHDVEFLEELIKLE